MLLLNTYVEMLANNNMHRNAAGDGICKSHQLVRVR